MRRPRDRDETAHTPDGGITPDDRANRSRRIYALCHTFATIALAAGVQPFELSRFMGTSVRMIDATYGHLSPGSVGRAAPLLDSYTG
jgi:hypothetical protein